MELGIILMSIGGVCIAIGAYLNSKDIAKLEKRIQKLENRGCSCSGRCE